VITILSVVALDEWRVDVNQIFNTQTSIDKCLHRFHTETIHITPYAIPVICHFIDHLAVGLAEPVVTFKKTAVSVDVGHQQLLVSESIGAHQVGVTGVIVDDEFVNLLQTVNVTFRQLFVFHSKPPVRIPGGKSTVGGNSVQLLRINKFKNRLENVQPVGTRMFFHRLLRIDQFRRERFIM